MCTPRPNRITIIDVARCLGEHRSRTSTFLATLPPSGVAYGMTYTLGIVIRVAEKIIGILLTVLLGLNPMHLCSHRTGLVCTNSTERAPPIQGLWRARLTKSSVLGINPRLSLIGQSKHLPPIPHGPPLTGSHHHTPITSYPSYPSGPDPGHSTHQVHPSRVNPLTPAGITKEIGQMQGISLELLNHHHPHGIQCSHCANLPSTS